MKKISIILLIISLALGSLGYWSELGIPFGGGVVFFGAIAAIILFTIFLVLRVIITRKLSIMILAFPLLYGSWGYWGLFTKSGRAAYDEMDGIFPLFALAFSCFVLAVLVGTRMVILFADKRKKRTTTQ